MHYKEFKSKENQELINNTNVIGNNFDTYSKEEELTYIYIFKLELSIIRIINKMNKYMSR